MVVLKSSITVHGFNHKSDTCPLKLEKYKKILEKNLKIAVENNSCIALLYCTTYCIMHSMNIV